MGHRRCSPVQFKGLRKLNFCLATAMQGAARMVMQTGMHPAAIKDSVTSALSPPLSPPRSILTQYSDSSPGRMHHRRPSCPRGRPRAVHCRTVHPGDRAARGRARTRAGQEVEHHLDGIVLALTRMIKLASRRLDVGAQPSARPGPPVGREAQSELLSLRSAPPSSTVMSFQQATPLNVCRSQTFEPHISDDRCAR